MFLIPFLVKQEDCQAAKVKCWKCDKLGYHLNVYRSSKKEVKSNKEETTKVDFEEIFHLKVNTLA